jgi:hypothetical protein
MSDDLCAELIAQLFGRCGPEDGPLRLGNELM